MNRWTEYCKELYNQPLKGNPKVLEITNNYEELSLPIMKSEIEKAVKSLKKRKSTGNDNIPGELVQAGGEKVIEILTLICNRIWTTGIWPKAWTQSLIITIPKKGNLKLCNNYRTISLISHPSKVLLNVILSRLRPQAENIIAEEQAGFRVGRSTSEQIFNLRMLCEKYTHHQQYLYHICIDFKKAFDRVWHKALWATMKNYNIDHDILRAIKGLYNNSTSAVYKDGMIGDWFKTTVSVIQGCLLSPTVFNLFLEKIMTDALDGHVCSVSIGGRPITNLRFTDDIDGLASSEEELRQLVERLVNTSDDYGMEINVGKTKTMTNHPEGIINPIQVKNEKVEEVQKFIYLGATISEDGSKPESIRRIAQATAILIKLKIIWNDKNITLKLKIRLMRSLVLSTFLYACESWTLTADIQRRIQAMAMRCFRRLLNINYRSHYQ